MSPIKFTTVVGTDGLIHPPAGISLPAGDIEVSVQPCSGVTRNLEARLEKLCALRGLDPKHLSENVRAILLEDLAHEDRGTKRPLPGPGALKGSILYMAPDFDAPLEDMKE